MAADAPTVAREELELPLLRYQWGYDTADFAMVADAIAEDIVVVALPDPTIGDEGFDAGPVRVVGAEQVLSNLRASRAGWAQRGELPRQTFTNFLIEDVDDDTARVRSYYALYAQTAVDGTVLIGVGSAFHELRNEGGTWRIARYRVLSTHLRGFKRLSTRPDTPYPKPD